MGEAKLISRFPAGIVTPPASKSIAHRAVICAGLAAIYGGGESVIENLALSKDITATLNAMESLGARYVRDGSALIVTRGESRSDTIDCGESGSTLRFLLPIAALDGAERLFTGRERLMERPLDAYDEVFNTAGVRFERTERGVTVQGPMKSGAFRLPGNVSSQYVSGLLLALPLLDGDSEIVLTTGLESKAYVELTIDVMRGFGVEIEWTEPSRFRVKGGQRYAFEDFQQYKRESFFVEGDWSQAAFFLAAAALGRDVKCCGLNPESLQGDRAFLDILRQAGARVETDANGDIRVKAEKLTAVTVDAREIPDLVPPIAALCCFCEGVSTITGAERLRIKESDRLRALTESLGGLGARISETSDGLSIEGISSLEGGTVDAHGDHRIAMAAAVAAIRSSWPVYLTGYECVDKSYPAFWDDWEGA